MSGMSVKQMVEEAELRKKVEVFHTTKTNEQGVTVPFGIKVQNRYPAVGLALKEALAKSKSEPETFRGGLPSHSS